MTFNKIKSAYMKSLIIVRHAKSDWGFGVSDKERTITIKGQNDIKLVANEIKSFLPSSFEVFSSTANRAKTTCLLFCNEIEFPSSQIQFLEDLYTFDENQLEKTIKKCKNSVKNLILFGHNEAITNFVNKFGSNYITNVPTAGLVYLQFDDIDNWNDIKSAKTIKTIFPKELD